MYHNQLKSTPRGEKGRETNDDEEIESILHALEGATRAGGDTAKFILISSRISVLQDSR